MEQPCLSCGRDTRAGTPLFAARKPGRDLQTGSDGFLCHACQAGSASAGSEHAVPLSGRYVVIDLQGGAAGMTGG